MPGLLIGDLFRRNAAARPARPAASLGDRVLTHRELDGQADRIASTFEGLGVAAGDRIACWCDTHLEVIPLFAGLARCGAVFAPLNARFGPEEVTPVARLARPRLLVADAERAEAAETVARDLDVPLLRLGESGAASDGPGRSLPELTRLARDAPFAAPLLRETDPHVIFFTSGSTGLPKGVVLSHRANWLRGFQGVFRDGPEISVCPFPLFHMAAFTLGLAAWQTGGELALTSPDADAILATVGRRRANHLYGLPAIWARLLERGFEPQEVATLHEADTGTSAVPPELLAELKERLPHTVTRIYYGSTEAGAGTALPDADCLSKPGSVGLAVPGVELRLGDRGEVLLRSPFLMDGYFENEAATREAMRDGWYHTGDLGALDEDGYLQVVGRLRDVIRTGGETVAPSEVEAALVDHPDVEEVAIVGLPDPQWGEVVCAVVVSRRDTSPTLDELRAHCADRLARFKQPRRLELLDSLPRTAATQQIQRALIVERLLSGR
ncbi:MAG: class I adenylate-forming enzyme family protein [Myxococcota bacterium]|nr:class I adenylate-forming enzyme family protein [Myxococcota bacterium]